MIKYVISLLILFFCVGHLFAQHSKEDSLKNILSRTDNDSLKVTTLLKIGDLHEFSAPDTSLIYYHKALFLAKELGVKSLIAKSYSYIGIINYYQSNYKQALDSYLSALEEIKYTDLDIEKANNYGNIGIVYSDLSEYEKSLIYYQKALEISKKQNNKESIAVNYLNIGIVYEKRNEYDQALDYYFNSLEIFKALAIGNSIATVELNIGSVYSSLTNYKEALVFYKKALLYFQKTDNINGLATVFVDVGSVYNELDDYPLALKYFEKALASFRKIENKNGEGLVLQNIAFLYNDLEDYSTAVNYGEEALIIAEKIKAIGIKKDVYNILSYSYSKLNNYQKAYEYKEKSSVLNAEIFNSEKLRVIAEMNARYEIDNKEKQIIIQKAEIEKSSLLAKKNKVEQEKKAIRFNFLIVIFVVLIVVFLILYRNYLNKLKTNNKIVEINKSLSTSIETLNFQKLHIEELYKDITDNINFAKTIQQSLLPSKELLDDFIKDYFIIYESKDIIGGDFYFAEKTDYGCSFGVADSTGHGVSGAIISIIGITYLHSIINESPEVSPKVVLELLRKRVAQTFKAFGSENNNGFDMAFCKYDQVNRSLLFSGALIPLWIIRNGDLIEYKAQRTTIANSLLDEPLIDVEVSLQEGDLIYLFTDGYVDQFGGENNKKFKFKQLRALLLEASKLPMKIQKLLIQKRLKAWMGDNEQTDDILLFCIKVQ